MNYALVFAGGVGSRMNAKARPKQFLEIHGKPIIIHTIECFEEHKDIDAICVVIVSEFLEYMEKLVVKYNIKKVKWIIEGGKSALESQYLGLECIRKSSSYSEDDIVLIHDGVRPLINKVLITDCINGVRLHGSAITVIPAIETIIQTDNKNMIVQTFPRNECQLARAPQAFKIGEILKVHDRAKAEGIYDFVDSASMMLHYRYKLYTIEGPMENIKVTTPADFYICRALLDARENSQIYGI